MFAYILSLHMVACTAKALIMKIRNAKELGLLVRERRLELKLSQAMLAERVGVSRLWIGLLEQGKSSAHLGLALRTLQALAIDLEAGEKIATSVGTSPKIDLDKLIRSRTSR